MSASSQPSNPNNCATCSHKKYQDLVHPGDRAWCYMFRDEPSTVCMQHTGRRALITEIMSAFQQQASTLENKS